MVKNADQTPQWGWLPETAHQGGQLILVNQAAIAKGQDNHPADEKRTPINPFDGDRQSALPPSHPIGQNQVIEFLDKALNKEGPLRLLVTGMSGIGKTYQTQEALSHHPWAKIQTFHVSRGLPVTQVLRQFIGQAFPQIFLRDIQDADLPTLWQTLTAQTDALLVFDNVPDARTWQEIAPAANCSLIATSQHRLSGFADVVSIDLLEEEAGLALCLQTANLGNETRLSVDLARRLFLACDRLPLAIIVAASTIAQNPWLDVQAFITSLENVAARAPRTEDWEERVNARLRLSLEHLNQNHQRSWALLSLLPGSFGRAQMAAIWQEEPEIRLHHLLIRNLLLPSALTLPTSSHQQRFRLHDLFRPLAAEILASLPKDDLDAAWRGLSRYITKLLTDYQRLSDKPETPELIELGFLITHDMDQIKSAAEFAKADHEWDSAEALVTYALSEALADRMGVLDRAFLLEEALFTLQGWQNSHPELYPIYRRQLLLAYGTSLQELGNLQEAEEKLIEGRRLAEDQKDAPAEALFWAQLGSLYQSQPLRINESLRAFRKALADLGKATPPKIRAKIMRDAGSGHLRLGRLDSASDALWVAQSLHEEIGDQIGLALTKSKQAEIALAKGELQTAQTLSAEAEQELNQAGLTKDRASTLKIKAKADLLQDKTARAFKAAAEALALHIEQAQSVEAIHGYALLSECHLQAGNLAEAADEARRAIRMAHSQGLIHEAANAMRVFAEACFETNRAHLAFKIARHAFAHHSNTVSRNARLDDGLLMVRILVKTKQYDEALALLHNQLKDEISAYGHAHQKALYQDLSAQIETHLNQSPYTTS